MHPEHSDIRHLLEQEMRQRLTDLRCELDAMEARQKRQSLWQWLRMVTRLFFLRGWR